jgi:serine/threonine protein kinase/tetratricopeptide (TPR) repeat protein
MTLAVHTRLGPYEIQARLGGGGMGEVYRARDTRLDRDVAVKVLPEQSAADPHALARFHREVKAVAALSHPNLLAIYDIGTDHGVTYAVMELLEGQTLGSRIKKGRIDWREAVEIGAAIADGLAAAHAKGVVHRDVKPENIFLTSDGGLKILDFGLARLVNKPAAPEAPEPPSLQTQPGTLLGTVSYMSPEQVRSQPADARSDLFALGCVLYEMATGRRPFVGDSAADTMAAILHTDPPALSQSGRDRPAELDRLILRCLEKDPSRRFSQARDVALALRSLGRAAIGGAAGQLSETVFYPLDTPSPLPAPVVAASVAVLPFRNMSSDPENEYFSDGLAEELINALTKVEGLHVASRTSAFAFKGKNEDVRKIGDQLNVRTVLEGSVRKAGNRLRISAQLVNVADGYHLWSETYNRELADIFDIQDEIAQNITRALRVILGEKDKRKERAPTTDVRAYEFYLRGRQFFHQFRRMGFEFALQMFAGAIGIDPNYARAHAGVADCHSLLFTYWDTDPAHLRQADEASRKALELDPGLAEAHVSRGLAVSLKKEYAEAEREFDAAIRLDPNLFEARYFFGRAFMAQGKLDEAARLYEQACQLRPDDYQAATHLGSIYAGLGRKADGQAACQRCAEVLVKHVELHPDDARALYLGAVVWCQLGEAARGLEWAERALAMDPEEPMTLYNVACFYSLQGKTGQALDCLENALKHGFAHKEWIEHDSDLAPLRDQPRYQALLKTL